MAMYKTLDEAFASIDYGMCFICKAKHEFPNVKCEFADEQGECDKCDSAYDVGSRDNRCGNCGNCGNCCTHKEAE